MQALANNATITDIITIKSADGTEKQITITITGVNGVATITGISTGAVTEDATSQVTSSLAISDEDSGEAVFVAQTNAAGSYGAFNLTILGNWTYDLDSSKAAIQALPNGATLTDSFIAVSADGTQKTVTITITGINGVASITGTSTGVATEDDNTQVTGSLAITDEDTGEAVFAVQTNTAGSYGAFNLTTSGDWTYDLDNSKAEVQALANGATLTDSFIAVSSDGSSSKVVTITISGVNGVASITGTSSGVVIEDRVTQVSGSLSITDEDSGEAIFVEQTNTTGLYGMFSLDSQGNWTFDLDNYNSFVQTMALDEQFSESFLVWSVDGTDSQVTITGYGTNDAPIAKADSFNEVVADNGIYVLDVLANDTDVDGDTLSIVGAHASLGEVTTDGKLLTFTSQLGFVGEVKLTYTITDGHNIFAQSSVELIITGALDATAPVITVPAPVDVNAKGLYTKVDLGIATALNSQGQAVPISLVNGKGLFTPGNTIAYWQAKDPISGLTAVASQKVMVHPLISFAKDQTVVEGKTVGVDIILNGESPTYPVVMTLDISGSANESDYSLDSKTVVIESGTQTRVLIDIVQDNVIETDETIILRINDGNNSDGASHTITIVEWNIAPKVVLSSKQNAETRQVITADGGLVSIEAMVDDANDDHVSTQWLYDLALNMTVVDDYNLTLDPSGLSSGIYSVNMTATDDGKDALSTTQTIYLEVVASLAELTAADSDGDLIPDNEEGYGDSDQDGIPDFQDAIAKCNVMPEQVVTQNGFLVEGEPGVCLRKGNTLAAGETGGLQLTDNDLDSSIGKDDVAQIVGGVFDYIATGLLQAGQSYQIVLPQVQPIPTGAMYRKYSTVTSLNKIGWDNFVEDVDNQLHSAAGELGYCPPPQSSQWTTGLTAGDWCVRLTIKDGGANDNDGEANGTIIDPGGVGVILNGNHLPVAVNDLVEMVVNSEQRIDVLSNDSDADGDSLTITSATTNIGTVSISSAGDKLYYVSANNYDGDITINYGISDNKGGTAHAVVTITMILSPPPVVTQVIEVSKTTTKGGGGFFWPLLVLMGCLVTRRRIQH